MRIAQETKQKIIEIDRRYRSSWDTRSIAHVVKASPTTVAKILREQRGPRPKPERRPHERRTCFLRRDVMWSSDFMELPDGRELIKTMDELSRYRLGWGAEKTETAAMTVRHGEDLIGRMGRAPLVWKYDHGSPFTSGAFQAFLVRHKIQPYPIPVRAPWVNGRNERDNQEVQNWLIPLDTEKMSEEEIDRDIDDGMLMLNYVKPRSVLGFKKSAEVYFSAAGIEDVDRDEFMWKVMDFESRLDHIGSERTHRKAICLTLEYYDLYREWKEVPKGFRMSTDHGH